MASKQHLSASTHTTEKKITKDIFLEERSKVIDDQNRFISIVSHDLLAPLRTLSGLIDLLDRNYGGSLDDEGNLFIEHAQTSTLKMQKMLDDLAVLARIHSQGNKFTEVDCNQIVETIFRHLQKTSSKKVNLEIGALPKIYADEAQIKTIFSHLIENAIKFNKQALAVINIQVQETDGEYHFTAKDNGIGIEEKYWQRVFDPFYKIDPELDPRSSGMGLALCQAIAVRHHGSISINSSCTTGTTISFKLPIPEH